MIFEQRLEQSQKLILSQTMLQSLKILQLSATELQTYLQEVELSNPLLNVEDLSVPDAVPIETQREREFSSSSQLTVFTQREDSADFTAFFTKPKSFTEYLKEQLGQMKLLDKEMLTRCLFLVDSLSPIGYLDTPLEELAKETGQTLFDMEQALFVLQSLDPIGVGARNLSECLLLQLAEGRHFTELNIHLIRFGLPLIAKHDMHALCTLLHTSKAKIEQAIETIRSLNPIPSQGFPIEQTCGYVFPEAVIRCEAGKVFVEMSERAAPHVRLDPTYCAMLGTEKDREVMEYLVKKQAEAKALLSNLNNRSRTIARVICAVVRAQEKYFLYGAELTSLTMQQLADELELSVSTVSRAIKGKYVQFGAKVFPIRNLLTATLQTATGVISVDAVKQQICRFITAEDPAAPLSDETISQALNGAGIPLARRTVAKYRAEMGIPTASVRKRQKL